MWFAYLQEVQNKYIGNPSREHQPEISHFRRAKANSDHMTDAIN